MNRQLTMRLLSIWGLIAVVGGFAVWVWSSHSVTVLPEGVSRSDYERIAQTMRIVLSRVPRRDEILFKMGIEQANSKKWNDAAILFANVSPHDSVGRESRYLQAQCVLQLDRLRESEKLFLEYLADRPIAGKPPWPFPAASEERLQAVHYLSYLFSVELRFDERKRLLGELVRRGEADLFDTLAYHFQSLMEWNNTHGMERLERACATSPDDWPMQAVLARYWIAQGRLEEAWSQLQECRRQQPLDLTIAAACLTCLEERGDQDGYLRLADELAPSNATDPVLLLQHRGRIASIRSRHSEAVSLFQRAINLDPANVACRLGLAQAWLSLEMPERRQQELAAVQSLVRIQNRLGWAASKTPTAEVLLEIAQLSNKAGLSTAAADVCRISIRQFKDPGPFEKLLQEVASESKSKSEGSK